MEHIQTLITDIEAYAARTGTRADLVCRRATGNPRMLDRLLRRAAILDEDVRRLRAYMAAGAAPEGLTSRNGNNAPTGGADCQAGAGE